MPTESLAELVRFAPDAYGVRWVNHVALFIVTDAGVILVDANGQVNPRTPALIKEAIRSVTAQPVKYVVYSHSAFDHSTGGAVHRLRQEDDPGAGRAQRRPLPGRSVHDRRLHRRPLPGGPTGHVRRPRP